MEIEDLFLTKNYMTPDTTLAGGYLAVAALLATGLSYFGIIIEQNTIVQIIGGIVALIGTIHLIYQHITLKKAVAASVAK